MGIFVALLRAVNVGGTGKLSSADLKAACTRAGFENVRTYIASGNAVFRSDKSAAQIKAALEKKLAALNGKPVGVFVRTAAEMAAILKGNPFGGRPANYTAVIFLDGKPPADALATATGRKEEEIEIGKREFYVFYGAGMGRSKLRIPAARGGTARNMNTVARLAEMAAAG